MNATARTSTAAIISLVFGILSWVLLPIIGALIAIVAGHVARSDIRNSREPVEGDVLAVIGLVLGYVHLLVMLLGLLLIFLVFGGIAALAIWGG